MLPEGAYCQELWGVYGLPYKSVCHGYMDGGRKHETSG